MELKTVVKVLDSENFTIHVHSDLTGYFEHNEKGDDWGGGLWFDEHMQLLDYDGVYELPKEVETALELAGYWSDALELGEE